MSEATPLLHRLLQRWPLEVTPHPLQALLEQGNMEPLFQPIVALESGAIDGHEATVREQTEHSAETSPMVLGAEQLAELQVAVELAGVGSALQGWGRAKEQGRVYLSLSACAVAALGEPQAMQRLQALFLCSHVPYKRAVVQINQHRKVSDMPALERAILALQALGCVIALDDVKASQRSLDLWLRLKPAIVKLDARMTTGLQDDPAKAKVLRTLANLGFKTGARLVAKAVDDATDLRIVRDAGIHLAQGLFLGSPAPAAVDTLNLRARNVLAEKWTPPDPEPQAQGVAAADIEPMRQGHGPQWWD